MHPLHADSPEALERLARRLKGAAPASTPADPRPGGPVGEGTGAKAPKA